MAHPAPLADGEQMGDQTVADTGFGTTGGKGFHVTFENGWTVSVQFGRGNYCDNYHWTGERGEEAPRSRDAEVAAWDGNGAWLKLAEHDDVIGHQKPAEVLAIMQRVAAMEAVQTAFVA